MMKKFNFLIITFTILAAAAAALPRIFPMACVSDFSGDYRIPYSMGYDYFLYARYAEQVSLMDVIPVIGDSVIWGHYTDSINTLSAHLNRIYKQKKFMNMGLDGIHPAVMKGLVEMNAPYFRNRKIIAGINLLWMSSPRHDLTGPVNREINHKLLLPQFETVIPSYSPSTEERVSSVIDRSVTLFMWIDHLKLEKFAGKSFYQWTMDNPGECISKYFTVHADKFTPPAGLNPEKMQEQSIEWVSADKSLQWKFMLETLLMLKKNGNRVIAVITPFNTYMMNEESRKKYYEILSKMESGLRANGIIAVMPSKPGRKYFADASHPTSEGYRLIADHLIGNRDFARFMEE